MKTGESMNSRPDNRIRKGAARIPWHVARAMLAILDYLWSDEFTDYQSRTVDARNGHVFRDLLIVRKFLKKVGVVNETERP